MKYRTPVYHRSPRNVRNACAMLGCKWNTDILTNEKITKNESQLFFPFPIFSATPFMNFMQTGHSITINFMKKKTPNDAVTPQRQSQFTPKMKANAVARLLSSLV